MSDRPFRFGAVAAGPTGLDEWIGLAQRAEQLGYDTLVTPDPHGDFDPLTVLSAGAAVTTTLRFGTFVLVNSLRSAPMLAWQARTLHSFSGGRFELGLGTGRPDAAGWANMLGREFGNGTQRRRRLADTVAVLDDQRNRPPLLLSAGGPKMRDFAASKADVVTMAWKPQTTEVEAQPIVDDFWRSAAHRSGEVELAINLMAVGDGPAPWLERFIGTSVAELAKIGAMTVLPGGTRSGVDLLREWRDRFGISYVTINSGFLERFAPIVAELTGR